MRIGLDFDGAISNCGKLKSDAAKQLYGVDIPPGRFKRELVVGEGPGQLSLVQYRDLQTIIYADRKVGLLMEPVDGALEYIPRLIADGHSVGVITSRKDSSLEVAREWSVMKGLKLDFVGLGYGESKAGAAAGLDVYIDDDLDKLEPLVGVVPNRYLFSWEYNSHIEAGTIATRVSSWGEFYNCIRTINFGH